MNQLLRLLAQYVVEKRLIAVLFALIFFSRNVFAQTGNPYPYASDIIKFDMITLRADKPIPFDRPFVLVVENVNTENIIRASIYRIDYVRGTRILYNDDNGTSYADYVIDAASMVIEKSKLTMLMPPLRPAMDFDILIEKKLSGRNLEKAHLLDKIIVDEGLPAAPPNRWSPSAVNAFRALRDSANNNSFFPPRDVFWIQSLDDYYDDVFLNYEANYRGMIADASYMTVAAGSVRFLNIAEVNTLLTQIPTNVQKFPDGHFLEQILEDGTVDQVLLGLRPLNAVHGVQLTERDQFDKRLINLSASISSFDSLYRSANELAGKNPAHDALRDQVRLVLQALQFNKNYISRNSKFITSTHSVFKEAIWLIGTTQSKDLQTKSSSIFTLDAGFTNIWARDLNNKVSYIPKLYWGVNIYFRGTDKNIRSRNIPKKRSKEVILSSGESIKVDYDVLSRKSWATHLCLTIGFTFGSLDKQNFDNFFAGSSMMVGPSLRLTRSFRLSAGAAFLKRANLNPVLADKKITVGTYLSASLDFDILNAIKSASNLFFK